MYVTALMGAGHTIPCCYSQSVIGETDGDCGTLQSSNSLYRLQVCWRPVLTLVGQESVLGVRVQTTWGALEASH